MKRRFNLQLWPVFILWMLSGLIISACAETPEAKGPDTLLLVTEPEQPLFLFDPVVVRSRVQDTENLVSHVELYAVELPTGQKDVLIRSDPAPFDQTTFTVSQVFTPIEPGHYVIKVVGYNKLGLHTESDFLGFDVSCRSLVRPGESKC